MLERLTELMMTVPMFFLVVDVSLLMSLVLTQSFADGRVGLDYFLMASAENIGFDQNSWFLMRTQSHSSARFEQP
jgi:hypothetical protein